MKIPERDAQTIPARIILMVLFLALLWGGNTVAMKISFTEFAPITAAGLRFAIGLLLIVSWAKFQGVSLKPDTREVPWLFVLGGLFAAQIAFFNWGTNLTHAGRASVMLNTYPLFVAAIAHFVVPGDRLTRWRMLGLVLAFGGVLIVFWDNLVGRQGSLLGDALVLMSGFQLGLLIVLTNRLVQRIHPYCLLVWEMSIGVPIFFLMAFLLEGRAGYGFSYPALAGLLYQGIIVAAFCFVAWTTILKHYPPGRLSVLFFTTPLWGVALGHTLLHEPITWGLGIGAVFIALGIYVVNRTPG